jgi:hypothetical protein
MRGTIDEWKAEAPKAEIFDRMDRIMDVTEEETRGSAGEKTKEQDRRDI